MAAAIGAAFGSTLADVPPAPAAVELAGAGPTAPSAATEPTSIHASLTSREWDALVDEVTRRIEDRITAELARRGRRFIPRTM